MDPEAQVISDIAPMLEQLSLDARRRVLSYLSARYAPPGRKGSSVSGPCKATGYSRPLDQVVHESVVKARVAEADKKLKEHWAKNPPSHEHEVGGQG